MPVWAEPVFNTYLAKDGSLLVSYELQGKDADAFFEHVTDTLKSGNEIKIVHQVSVKRGKIFSNTLAITESISAISYDLLQSLYRYKNKYINTSDEIRVKKDILSSKKLPMLLKGKLVAGDEYRIIVKVFTRSLNKEKTPNTWKKWIPKLQLPSFTQKSITYEVPYIAR
jgi:hypothetical protein